MLEIILIVASTVFIVVLISLFIVGAEDEDINRDRYFKKKEKRLIKTLEYEYSICVQKVKLKMACGKRYIVYYKISNADCYICHQIYNSIQEVYNNKRKIKKEALKEMFGEIKLYESKENKD